MRWLLVLFAFSTLYSEEKVAFFSGWVGSQAEFQDLLERRGYTQTLVEIDLQKYKREHSLLKHLHPRPKLDPKIQKCVFMNVPRSAGRKYNLHKLPKEKMVLFMWEPPIRLGKMYSEKVQNCFSKIYTWNDDLVDNKTYFKFHYPVLNPMREDLPSFEEKKFCTMIVGFTNDKSRRHQNELYSKRIGVIRFFEKNHPEDFEFYGYNWQPDEFPSYRGALEDKFETNKNYRFSFCYENCRDLPGYITEKIFDCFAVGSVPIYLGANNVTDYIPKNCFIDRRDFATLDELYQFLKGVTKEEYECYLDNIRAFLDSEKAQVFSYENFETLFCETITRK